MDFTSNISIRKSINRSPHKIYEVYELQPISKPTSLSQSPLRNNRVYNTPQPKRESDLVRTGRNTDIKNIYSYQQADSLPSIKSLKRSSKKPYQQSLSAPKKVQDSKIKTDTLNTLQRLKDQVISDKKLLIENRTRLDYMSNPPSLNSEISRQKTSSGFYTDRSGSSILYKKYLPKKLEPLGVYPVSKIIVYKKGVEISNLLFMVEISTDSRWFYIVAYDVERPERYCLNLMANECFRIMRGVDNFDRLIGLLEWNGVDLVMKEEKDI